MASLVARSLAAAVRRGVAISSIVPRAPLAGRAASLARDVSFSASPLARRALSTATGDDAGKDSRAVAAPAVDSLDENRFLELAEESLTEIQTWLDGIEEMLDESDVTLSQGVLKIDLGEHGTWVLNRQVPNRQIWWSSPISGPRRYELDAATGKWLNTRDKTELFERLQDEIADATGISIFQ